MKEKILVLDFGGQYNRLIARRVREAKVYCEIWPYNAPIEKIKEFNPKGIIFTGGPATVSDDKAPICDMGIYDLGVPILGICYGMQLMSHMLGGSVERAANREYGKTELTIKSEKYIFSGIPRETTCWMSHTFYVDRIPVGFEISAYTFNCPVAAMQNTEKKFFAVQFHPEVNHTPFGFEILKRFLYDVCLCKGDWEMHSYVDQTVEFIKNKVGDKKVLCALSGGVDSSVAAVLVNKAIGNNLTCIFVDHGLLRKNEGDQVEQIFKDGFKLNLIRVDAKDRFLNKLKGVTDPETKRKIIGREFIGVFEEEAKKIGKVDFLVQGTIYPDVIESGLGNAAVIKSHHNVGGLPDHVDFEEILEPLKYLFKDEVRDAGRELGIPEDIVARQPFPGPGLAVRIIGEVTEDKLDILRDADHIFREVLKQRGVAGQLSQYFAVLTGMRSVGVMGDERTYDYTLALRAVTTNDFMTADWAKIPWDVIEIISNRIVNEVKNINRIVYDVTGKPPATIEWE